MPILAAPRLLKPDRRVLAPGWDDAPGARPRGRWWRRLLSGRAAITKFQPGGCCCGNCGPCTLAFPMTLTDSFTSLTLTAADSGIICYTLPVASASSPCDCFNNTPPAGGGSMLITYRVIFTGTVACSVQIARGWFFCYGGPNFGTPHYCVDSINTTTCTNGAITCGVTTIACNDARINGGAGCSDFYSGNLTSCTFPQTFTLTNCSTTAGGATLSSPLAANVTIG